MYYWNVTRFYISDPNGMGARFANPTAAQIAANVLGVKYEALERQVTDCVWHVTLNKQCECICLLKAAVSGTVKRRIIYSLVFKQPWAALWSVVLFIV